LQCALHYIYIHLYDLFMYTCIIIYYNLYKYTLYVYVLYYDKLLKIVNPKYVIRYNFKFIIISIEKNNIVQFILTYFVYKCILN
jgi:hypothetical protein